MVKANSVRVNMRLRDEARFALEELADQWGCSQTAAFERAVLEAHKRVSAGEAASFEAGRVVSVAGPVVRSEITIFCQHCREPFGGQKFQPPLCGECKAGGHRLNPANCPVCMDMGTGAL